MHKRFIYIGFSCMVHFVKYGINCSMNISSLPLYM